MEQPIWYDCYKLSDKLSTLEKLTLVFGCHPTALISSSEVGNLMKTCILKRWLCNVGLESKAWLMLAKRRNCLDCCAKRQVCFPQPTPQCVGERSTQWSKNEWEVCPVWVGGNGNPIPDFNPYDSHGQSSYPLCFRIRKWLKTQIGLVREMLRM